jgi:hypothetical protein
LIKDPRLKNPIVNFDALDEEAPWWNVDAAISALGTTTRITPLRDEYEKIETSYPVTVATLVRDCGARSFVYVSSIGASRSSRWFYLRAKGNTEDQLRRLGLPSLTLVRPSGIIGTRQPPRRAEELVLGLFKVARPLIPRRWRVVTGEQVARALLGAALKAPSGTRIGNHSKPLMAHCPYATVERMHERSERTRIAFQSHHENKNRISGGSSNAR